MNAKVARAFRQLYLEKRTGVLVSEADQAKRSVVFSSGFVVGARSSLKEDRLGEVMVAQGRISAENLADASSFIKTGRRLGEILVDLALVRREELEGFIRLQLLSIASRLVVDPPRRLAFSDLREVDSVVATPVSVAEVLIEAARRTTRIASHLTALSRDRRPLGFAHDPLLRFQSLVLTPAEAFVMSRVDGKTPPSEIFVVSPFSEEQTTRTLLGLMSAGVVEPLGESGEAESRPPKKRDPKEGGAAAVDPASAARSENETIQAEVDRLFRHFQNQDHWQVLGLARGADASQVKAAFFQMAKRYHPDRHRGLINPEFQERLSYVFNRVSEAYETLRKRAESNRYHKLAEKEPQYDEQRKAWEAPASPPLPAASAPEPPAPRRPAPPAAKPDPARTRDPLQAKALFVRARKAYERKDYWDAIQLSRQAIEIVGDRAEYFHLLGQALSHNPKWRTDAEQNLRIAANLDPWNAHYLVALGELYRRAGMYMRARRMFEQARTIEPQVKIPEE